MVFVVTKMKGAHEIDTRRCVHLYVENLFNVWRNVEWRFTKSYVKDSCFCERLFGTLY